MGLWSHMLHLCDDCFHFTSSTSTFLPQSIVIFFPPLFIMWKVEKGGWKNKLLCMRKCSLTTMCGWGGQGQFRDLLKRWRNTHLLGSPKGSRKNPQDSKNKAGKKFRLAGYRCHKEKADVKCEPTGLMRKSGNRWVRWLNGGNVPGSLFPTYTSIKHISVTTSLYLISVYMYSIKHMGSLIYNVNRRSIFNDVGSFNERLSGKCGK